MFASTETAVRVALAAKLPTVENFNDAVAVRQQMCCLSAKPHAASNSPKVFQFTEEDGG